MHETLDGGSQLTVFGDGAERVGLEGDGLGGEDGGGVGVSPAVGGVGEGEVTVRDDGFGDVDSGEGWC